jgi:hypothetical protein
MNGALAIGSREEKCALEDPGKNSDDRREEAMHATWMATARLYRFVIAIALIGGLVSVSARAEEGGKWRGRAVLVVTSNKTVNVADKANHEVDLNELDGIIFGEGDKPFLDKARYQVVSLFDSSGLVNGGYKTFTASDGSQVIAQFQVTGGAWPRFMGKWSFVAGTNKYRGISGNGTFNITWTSNDTAWDILEGDYKIP